MRSLGIRDVIGPIMVGPSSSHTAGALRHRAHERGGCWRHAPAEARDVHPARLASRTPATGHGTDQRPGGRRCWGFPPTTYASAIPSALAEAAGLAFRFVPDPSTPAEHPNTVDIRVRDASGAVTQVRGESIGGGAAQITGINGVDVLLTGEYHSLVVNERDVRGVLAFIARCVAEMEVNIATTRLPASAKATWPTRSWKPTTPSPRPSSRC